METAAPSPLATTSPETAPARSTRATVIFNPTAGRHQADVEAAEAFLTGHGWSVRRERTGQKGDGTRLAREAAARGDNVVVVAGGDGTINEAIQGLAGTDTALGVLPLGTTNVWAREAGVPANDVAGAAAILVDGDRQAIDLGRAGDRFFLLMAGLGFDGAVTGALDLRLKRMMGRGAYALTAALEALRYKGPEVVLEMDDETVRCRLLQVVAGNTRLYGGDFSLTSGAIADDGLLDVVVFEGRRLWDAAPRAVALSLGRRLTPASPNYYRTRRLRVTAAASAPAPPSQIDGDHVDAVAPLDIVAVPAALRVIVPRDTRSPLFGKQPLPAPVAPPAPSFPGDTHEA